jgi:hypothetical protein
MRTVFPEEDQRAGEKLIFFIPFRLLNVSFKLGFFRVVPSDLPSGQSPIGDATESTTPTASSNVWLVMFTIFVCATTRRGDGVALPFVHRQTVMNRNRIVCFIILRCQRLH